MDRMLKVTSILIVITTNFVQPATPDTNVEIHATPSSIHEGFTKNLQINCSVSHSQASAFHLLVSLILSKTDTTDDNTFTEIADITSVSPDSVEVKDAFGATSVNGHLAPDGSGFISYQWDVPSRDVTGVYRCTAHGMDKTGHPMEMSTVSEVMDKEVDLSMVLEKMRQLEVTQGQLARELDATKTDLNRTKEELSNTKTELNTTQNELAVTKFELNNNTTKTSAACTCAAGTGTGNAAAVPPSSETFNGHRYFLTRGVEWNVDVADAVCHLYGGYLVEIDDQQEWDFVVSFLTTHSVPQGFTSDVFIGMTDEDEEDRWTYFHSRKNVTFTRWEQNQPDNGDSENCAYIRTAAMAMDNYKCFDAGMKRSSLCEVEV